MREAPLQFVVTLIRNASRTSGIDGVRLITPSTAKHDATEFGIP